MSCVGSVPDRLRPIAFVASTSGEDPNCAEADDSAGVLVCPGTEDDANDGDGRGARGAIIPFGRGAGEETPFNSGDAPARCRAFVLGPGSSRDESVLPLTISSSPSSDAHALTPPTNIIGMLRRIFLNSSSYIARMSDVRAGEALTDCEASSQITTTSKVSRTENHWRSALGAMTRESSMLSEVTLLTGNDQTSSCSYRMGTHTSLAGAPWARCIPQLGP